MEYIPHGEYTPEQAQEAFKKIELIRKMVSSSNQIPLILGKMFYEAGENEWFEKNGIEIEDFYGEIKVSHKTIYAYEGLYKVFCLTAGYTIDQLSEVTNSRLAMLKRALFETNEDGDYELKVTKEVLDEWIEKAKLLSTTDFKIEYKQAFSDKKNPDDCNHENAAPHAYLACPDCGERIWIDPETKEPIKHWHNQK